MVNNPRVPLTIGDKVVLLNLGPFKDLKGSIATVTWVSHVGTRVVIKLKGGRALIYGNEMSYEWHLSNLGRYNGSK